MWVGRQAWTWRVVTFDHAPVHSARSDIAPRVHVTVGLLLCRTKEAGLSPRNSASACTKRASWAGSTATATSSCHQKRCCFAIGTATSPCHRRRGSKRNWRVIRTSSNVLSFLTWLAPGGKSSSSMTLTRLAGACGGPVMQSHLPLPKPWQIGPRLQQTSIGRPSFRTLILTMLKVASVNGTSSMRSLMSPCITFTRWTSQVPSLLGRSLRNNNAMDSAMLGRSKSHAEMDTGSQ